MGFHRKYDIGHGVTITDDGYTIRADWKTDEKSSISVGTERPNADVGDEVSVRYSRDHKHFYIPRYAGMHGDWMSVATYPDVESIKALNLGGLGPPGYVQIKKRFGDTHETYYRELLHFSVWSVKADPADVVETIDEKCKDYLSMCHARVEAEGKRFDEEIKFTGRTLAWIMEKIGPWQSAPPEPPPIVLTD